ncbi:hypothetical protein [Nocardia macrotermitis]|uniref:Uncharacterized protein n=1 Tax=Nocardia macrotermitis TaxID=2585198 RepID=A0A7K0D6B6_9NOCA|nr:hypothetical protein [Nocardia macrotermitis]MQY21267.1 hypothetical protein [Nocardia macrotermitis]
MPAQSPLPQPDPDASVPLSRRERRGKRTDQQSPGGKLSNYGSQHVPPARKHNNYRRSWH